MEREVFQNSSILDSCPSSLVGDLVFLLNPLQTTKAITHPILAAPLSFLKIKEPQILEQHVEEYG